MLTFSRLTLLGVFLAGMLAYANTISHPFVHDDVVFILKNPNVHSLNHLKDVLTPAVFVEQNVEVANPYYRPVLDAVYIAMYHWFGPHPQGYHLLNIVLHMINGLLVFVLTQKIFGREGFAFAAAMLFIVHPVQTESVACIAGISNLMFTVFCLCSLWYYLKVANEPGPYGFIEELCYYSASLVFFGAALLSKEQAVILPFIILWLEFVFAKRGTANPYWRLRIAGFAIVVGGYFLWRKIILGSFSTHFVANMGEFVLRIKAIPGMMLEYMRIMFWPGDLHYYRSYNILNEWVPGLLLFLALVLGVILVARKISHKQQIFLIFSVGWFFITLLPTTSIVPLVHEYSWIAAFEHFLYLSLLGFIWASLILGEIFCDWIFHHQTHRAQQILLTSLIGLGLLGSIIQNRVWAGEVPLFERAVRYEPQMGRLRLLLAQAYFSQGHIFQAHQEYLNAAAIMNHYLTLVKDERVRPFYLSFWKDSVKGAAFCEQALGDLTRAKSKYQQVLKVFPRDGMSRINLGVMSIQLEKWDEAVVHFEEALKADAKNPQLLTNLGVCYAQKGQFQKAEKCFRDSLRLDPAFTAAQNNLKKVLLHQQVSHP